MLQGLERRLQGAVGNTFARLFGGGVRPAEVVSALQDEAAGHVRRQGSRTIAPNHFIVRLGPRDRAEVGDAVDRVSAAFGDVLSEYLVERGWETFGEVAVTLEQSDALHTGQFRISSLIDPDVDRRSATRSAGVGPMTQPPDDAHQQEPGYPGQAAPPARATPAPDAEPGSGAHPAQPGGYAAAPGAYPPAQYPPATAPHAPSPEGRYEPPSGGQWAQQQPGYGYQGSAPDPYKSPPQQAYEPQTSLPPAADVGRYPSGNPGDGQPGYGQPQYGQATYGQPAYGQPAEFAAPAPVPGPQPGYSPPGPQPGYPPSGPQPAYPQSGPQPGYPQSGGPPGSPPYGSQLPGSPPYGSPPPGSPPAAPDQAGYAQQGYGYGHQGAPPDPYSGYQQAPSPAVYPQPAAYQQPPLPHPLPVSPPSYPPQAPYQAQPGCPQQAQYPPQAEQPGYPAPAIDVHAVLSVDDGSGRTYQLQRGSNVVGRGQEAAFRLPDTAVSRRHVDVYFDGQVAVMHDLGSTNGTSVNGSTVKTWQLADGDVIRVGHSTVVFHLR